MTSKRRRSSIPRAKTPDNDSPKLKKHKKESDLKPRTIRQRHGNKLVPESLNDDDGTHVIDSHFYDKLADDYGNTNSETRSRSMKAQVFEEDGIIYGCMLVLLDTKQFFKLQILLSEPDGDCFHLYTRSGLLKKKRGDNSVILSKGRIGVKYYAPSKIEQVIQKFENLFYEKTKNRWSDYINKGRFRPKSNYFRVVPIRSDLSDMHMRKTNIIHKISQTDILPDEVLERFYTAVPDEIYFIIISFLDIPSFVALASTCNRLHTILTRDHVNLDYWAKAGHYSMIRYGPYPHNCTFEHTNEHMTQCYLSHEEDDNISLYDLWNMEIDNKFSKLLLTDDKLLMCQELTKKAYEKSGSKLRLIPLDQKEWVRREYCLSRLFTKKLPTEKIEVCDVGTTFKQVFDSHLVQYHSAQTRQITIGPFAQNVFVQGECEKALSCFINHAQYLQHINSIYLGNIEDDWAAIKHIRLSSIAELLDSFPKLLHVTTYGSTFNSFNPIKHSNLMSLVIISGELSHIVLQGLWDSDLPNLCHLEIWLGDSNDCDLTQLLTKEENGLFPSLHYLGIRNYQFIDNIMESIVESNIVKRIRIIDVSFGNLTNAGAEHLLKLKNCPLLELIDIQRHNLDSDMIVSLCNELSALILAVNRRCDDEGLLYISEYGDPP